MIFNCVPTSYDEVKLKKSRSRSKNRFCWYFASLKVSNWKKSSYLFLNSQYNSWNSRKIVINLTGMKKKKKWNMCMILLRTNLGSLWMRLPSRRMHQYDLSSFFNKVKFWHIFVYINKADIYPILSGTSEVARFIFMLFALLHTFIMVVQNTVFTHSWRHYIRSMFCKINVLRPNNGRKKTCLKLILSY